MTTDDDLIAKTMREEDCGFPEAVKKIWERLPAATKAAATWAPKRFLLEVKPPRKPGDDWEVCGYPDGPSVGDPHLELAVAGVVDDDEFRAAYRLEAVRDPETGAFLARYFARGDRDD